MAELSWARHKLILGKLIIEIIEKQQGKRHQITSF